MNLLDRIRLVFSQCGQKQKDIATALDVTPAYISRIMKLDDINPSQSFLKAICNSYAINYDWLITGNGDMKKDESAVKDILRSILPDNDFAVNVMAAAADMPLEWWQDMERLVKELKNKTAGC